MTRDLLIASTLAFVSIVPVYAQATSGSVFGTVLDPSQAAIPSATVEIQNPVSHYTQTVKTDSQAGSVSRIFRSTTTT